MTTTIKFTEYGRHWEVTCPKFVQARALAFNMQRRVIDYIREIAKRHRPIEYVVDVGACVGFFTIPFHIAFPDAHILAIEPSKYNFPHLEYNTKHISNVKRIKIAVGNEREQLRIAAPTQIQRPEPEHDIDTGLISAYGMSDKYLEMVDSEKLDNLIDKRVDWLKIDVEGSEIPVLEGAIDILTQHRPTLQIEFRPENQRYGGFNQARLLGTIITNGYRLIGEIRGDLMFIPSEYDGGTSIV